MPELRCPPVSNATSAGKVNSVIFEYDRVSPRISPYRLGNTHPSLVTALGKFVHSMEKYGMGLEAVLTAGAYNCRYTRRTRVMSPHGTGKAIDVDGVRFRGGREVLVRQYREETEVLDRVQACLRMHFGIVLDWRYNDLHRDHFHCDLTRKVGEAKKSLTSYLQAALNRVIDAELQVDGVLGRKTKAAIRKFEGQNGLPLTGIAKSRTLQALLGAAASGRDIEEERPGEEWALAIDGKSIPNIINVDGRTYMPLRAGLEAIGYELTVEGRKIVAQKSSGDGE